MPDTRPEIQVGQDRVLPDDLSKVTEIPPHPGLTPGAGGFGVPDGRIGDVHRMLVTSDPRTVVAIGADGSVNTQDAVSHAAGVLAPETPGETPQAATPSPTPSTPKQAQGGPADADVLQSGGTSSGAAGSAK